MSYPEPPNGGPYPPVRDPRDYGDSQYPPPPPPSEYPPPPGEEDDRRAYNARVAQGIPQSNVTLPSISSPYEPQYAPPQNGYAPDPRYRPEPQYHPGQPQPYPPQRGYPGDYPRGGPQHMQFATSAPRQRTAIACRYCRRRKIRCSGFEDNPSGKCQNCTRFQQECIFTPVSSQAQAFVPVHAAYPHMPLGPDGRPRMMYPQQLYGAHGQPLGPMQPQHGGPPPPQVYSDYPMPSPTAPYYPNENRGEMSRKRPHDEPQPSLLPPPQPGQPPYPRSDPGRRVADEDLIDRRLPPVTPIVAQATSNYSPVSSSAKAPRVGSEPLPPPMARDSPNPGPARSSPKDRADPMALGNIIGRPDTGDIDKSMLGRLNNRKQ